MGLQNRMMGHGTTATAQPLQRAQRCWIRPVLARKQVQALAFRLATAPPQQPQPAHQEAPTVLLPLDFYACLGVTRTAGSRAVRDALDKALLKRPEAYFSSDTVALRDLLLRNAAECLLNYEKRREYDAKALSDNGYVVSVSEYHLPGALVLLQESGCHHLVLDLGTQWLSDNRQDPRRRDVSAVTALAHYGLAVEHLQQDTGCMLEACRHLESALVLIRQCCHNSEDASTAADLQRDVLQLLKDYSPDYCLALLALPLDDPQRQRGLTLMRKLLLELPEELSPLGADKDDFLVAARTLMTAQEHLNLYASIATSCSSMQQQQLVAEATVALAFQQRNPVRMLQAAGAFKLLDQTVAKEGGGADLCVEHACIALLLGNTPKALQELGLGPEGHADSSSATQQAAQQYVLAHCQDRTDLLPGVYALAQCWVQQGILGGFRQVAAAVDGGQEQQEAGELDLAPWFDSLRVRLLILVLAFVTKAKQCLEAVIGLPAAVMVSMAWLQRSTGTSHHAQHAPASSSTSSEPPADSKCTQPAAAPAEPQANSTTERSGMSRTSSSSSSMGRSTSAVTPGSATGASSSSSSSGHGGVGRAGSAGSDAVHQESTSSDAAHAGRMQAATATTPNSQQQKQPADTSSVQRKQQGRDHQGRPADSKSSAAEHVAPATPAPHAVQVQHDRQGPHPGPLGSSPQQEQHQAVPQQQHAASRVQGINNGSAAAKLKGKLGAGVKGQAQVPPSAAAPESQAVAPVGPPGAAEAPSLMARARAAATNKQGAAGAHSSVDDDAGPEPSPGQRKRLSRQMVSLEAQMWDPAPEEPKWKAAALKVLPLLVVGAAVVLAASTRQPPAASLPQGALLIDSRG